MPSSAYPAHGAGRNTREPSDCDGNRGSLFLAGSPQTASSLPDCTEAAASRATLVDRVACTRAGKGVHIRAAGCVATPTGVRTACGRGPN